MTDYHMYGLTLSANQIQKIAAAAKKHHEVKIRLSKNNLQGDHKLPLTQRQINRIEKSKTGIDFELSASQLQHLEKSGGFLPLLALLPAIFGGLGAAGGLAGGIASAVSAAKNGRETERHNREVEAQLQKGSGVVSNFVSKVPFLGSLLAPVLERFGLGINAQNRLMKGSCVCLRKLGKGLYMKPYGGGLFLGPRGNGLFLGPPQS
jgi:hypothetical protein